MVPVIYVIAGGLALWGVVVIVSGDLVAMLDIATTLFGAAAIVASLGAVAGALNRISRTINRITVEATDLQEAMAAAGSPMVYNPQEQPYAADGPDQSGRARKRDARVRRKARGVANDALDEDGPGGPPPLPAVSSAVTEERLGSGARAWVERRETAESYAPRRRAEAQPSQSPPPAEVPDGGGQQSDVVRSGTLNGVLYRFYADGSVEAVTPTGLRRFESMEELREIIVASRGGIAGPAAETEDAAASGADAPQRHLPAAPQLPAYARTDTVEETNEAEGPGEEQLTPEKRLELFQQNIWATTLAELRRSPERRDRDEGDR